MEALNDAGIEKHPNYAERIGVYIGSGIGGLPLIEATHTLNTSVGPKKISPFFIPGSIINMIAEIYQLNMVLKVLIWRFQLHVLLLLIVLVNHLEPFNIMMLM